MEETFISPINLGKSISEWGFMALASAFYLTYSALLFGFFIRWLIRIVNGIINEQKQALDNIQALQRQSLDLQEKQLELLQLQQDQTARPGKLRRMANTP